MFRISRTSPVTRVAVPLLALGITALAALATTTVTSATAAPPVEKIVLPGAKSIEGIAAGRGDTFYAGDLIRGDIYRGDFRRGTAEMFIDVPDGRMAVGMTANLTHGLLFVAGGPGKAYVYSTTTGATVATYDLADPAGSTINDVTLTSRGAWFTDSNQAKLYFVPVSRTGVLGPARTLTVTGPASDTSGQFNFNGIRATPDGQSLIVAHSATGLLYKVNAATGASVTIAGVSLPRVDGIELQGGRLWAVLQGNQVTQIRLNQQFDSGVVEKVITSDLFQTPATAVRWRDRLAVTNAKFDTGFPPTADTYEVVLVRV